MFEGRVVRAVVLGVGMMVTRAAAATEYHGQVLFGGVPVPGATVTATQGDKKVSVVTDTQGSYFFADLPDGSWKVTVEMRFFTASEQTVEIKAGVSASTFALELLPKDQILAQATAVAAPTTGGQAVPVSVNAAATPAAPGSKAAAKAPAKTADAGGAAPAPPPEDTPKPSDGFLINGTSNNAATSQFSLAPAFGNNRSGGHSLYTGGVSVVEDNSALNARPYVISGTPQEKIPYNRVVAGITLGGPINIPHLMPRGPNFFVQYQWTRQYQATTGQGLVPTVAERAGNLTGALNSAGQQVVPYNPATGLPYANNTVPVSTVAANLLKLYPLPNVTGDTQYNYEIPLLNSTHQDLGQGRLNKGVTRKDNVDGSYAFSNTRLSNTNLFGFVDRTNILGMRGTLNENHRLNQRLYITAGYVFSRQRTQVKPNFEGVQNVSGSAGVAAGGNGNLQDPTDWGPPTLQFSNGIYPLSDANSAYNRNETNEGLASAQWYHGKHNVTAGVDYQRRESNYLAQSNPRGLYQFTGLATENAAKSSTTGSDFADFLIGTPDASQIAYGNADKYFRQSVYALYVNDDWRVRPELTINGGLRWEYGAPMTELKGRLVNLDVAQNFTNAAAVVANQSLNGTLSGTAYPTSLVRPDKTGFEPRIGISWRPIAGSTLVVRAGYGIYDDTSVYGQTALAMAQQAPLSTSLNASNSATCPLTLEAGFKQCGTTTSQTFAVDPNFRVGYAQSWQLLAQRDLPGALQATVTYLGIKGTRGVQQFLPQTYPIGEVSPCPSCPVGYQYRTSNGDSTRESGQVQVRRRLKNGFTANISYTYSKSIDDDAQLGGQGPIGAGSTSATGQTATIAQDWTNLRGERGLSTFDQRHLVTGSAQYTSGQGMGGGSLMEGWRGTLLKEWTVSSTVTAGSGLPETPIYFAQVPGTAITGTIRASRTGQSIYATSAPNLHLNAAAYMQPLAGQWGNAGRNSIEGPDTFSLLSSMSRTFRLKGRYNLDVRADITNAINHPVYTSWLNTINNTAQFGLPSGTNAMRSLQFTTRLRF